MSIFEEVQVSPKALDKSVYLPTSKSYANRLLLLGSVHPEKFTIEDLPDATDVINLLNALRELGLEIKEVDTQTIEIANHFPNCERKDIEHLKIHTGDGGTTNRFLASLLLKGLKKYSLIPSAHMATRPLDEFLEIASKLQVEANKGEEEWLTLQGPAKSFNSITVDCSRTTQIATGLALAFAFDSIIVEPLKMENSQAYWQMTQMILENKNRTYWRVPVDYSSASYPMALAAATGRVHLPQIQNSDPYQADSELLGLLQKMGAIIKWSDSGLVVEKPRGNLEGFEAEIPRYPDLAPTLAFLAACCKDSCRLKDTRVLRYKETDRVQEIINLLSIFDVESKLKGDDLIIYGPAKRSKKQVVYEAPADHRMVMSSYLFMRTFRPGLIKNAQHARKSFPNFFQVMN